MPSSVIVHGREVTRAFGGLLAVDRVDIDVLEGETRALIGPNGAGKSTLLNLLTGTMPPTGGEIRINGESIIGRSCYEVTSLGMARTFQNVQLFENMTLLENVMVGCHCWTRQGIAAGALRLLGHWREEARIREEARAQLRRVGLEGRDEMPAGSLPFGEQRMLEIARALASHPRVLMLDEPASGLSTRERAALSSLLTQVVDEGVTVLLVDHDMQFVMEISDRVMVLDHGRKIADGTAEEVQNDPHVIAAYLGTEEEQ